MIFGDKKAMLNFHITIEKASSPPKNIVLLLFSRGFFARRYSRERTPDVGSAALSASRSSDVNEHHDLMFVTLTPLMKLSLFYTDLTTKTSLTPRILVDFPCAPERETSKMRFVPHEYLGIVFMICRDVVVSWPNVYKSEG